MVRCRRTVLGAALLVCWTLAWTWSRIINEHPQPQQPKHQHAAKLDSANVHVHVPAATAPPTLPPQQPPLRMVPCKSCHIWPAVNGHAVHAEDGDQATLLFSATTRIIYSNTITGEALPFLKQALPLQQSTFFPASLQSAGGGGGGGGGSRERKGSRRSNGNGNSDCKSTPTSTAVDELTLAAVKINLKSSAVSLPNATEDEWYSLRIARGDDDNAEYKGEVVAEVDATTVFGVVHAFRTLGMLIGGGAAGTVRCPAPLSLPTAIDDTPRFAYRGFVADVAHVFMPFPQLKRLVAALSTLKYNVLHLHLTDTQAFRVQVTSIPGLAEKSVGMDDTLLYSRAQLKALTHHAWLHGVTIVPELDVPGHAQGWIAGSAPGTVLKGRFATTGKVSAQLNPTDPATAELVQRILAEMVEDATNGRASNGDGNGDGNSINVDVDGRMHGNSNPDVADAAAAAGVDDDDVAKNKQLPALPYLHIGGDEVDLDAYGKTTSEALRAWATFDRTMRQGKALQAYVQGGGKVIQWEEAFALRPPKDTVIEVWRGVEPNHTLLDIVFAGYTTIVTNIHYWYLDKQFLRPWPDVYKFDPLRSGSQSKPSGARIPEQYHHQVLGGEAGCWGNCMPKGGMPEQLPWAALVAVAERLWSPVLEERGTRLEARHARALQVIEACWGRWGDTPP